MPRPAPREKSRSTERLTFNELFLTQQQETNKRLDQMDKRLDQMDKRLDRVENRMDKLEEKLETTRQELNSRMDKQDAKIDKLADKIDDMHKEIKSSANHGQIATISTIGIAIAVIYSLLR